ncbi:hypothetical protein GOODEAATRI_017854 [Goodea atripinnis]|uniref:Ninjurin 1 n=1 Tax=Goodea atripinnis TaxID=208336 RepID=A0ABV0PPH1_9TELE
MVCVGFQVSRQGNRIMRQHRPLNMNHYANKKSAAESMLDVALLMANASQLKAVLEQGPNFSFYVPLITLISISLTLQVLVGVMLIFIGKWLSTSSSQPSGSSDPIRELQHLLDLTAAHSDITLLLLFTRSTLTYD